MDQSSLFHRIKQDKAPEVIKVIIEIKKGDHVKYEYDHETGVLVVDRVLYGPVFYPAAYADVPGTWNIHDGDPLDAVVYTSGDLLPGSMVYGRVIGLMQMIDNGEIDHKIIVVNDKDPRYKHIEKIEDLPPYDIKDLQTFMETYKYAQTGPGSVKIPGFNGKEDAYKFILESMEEYRKKFGVGE